MLGCVMEIDSLVGTYHRWGGMSPYAYIMALLRIRLVEYGEAVKTIELYPRLPFLNPSKADAADETFLRWQMAMDDLPFVTFRRALKRIEISFRSTYFNSADLDEGCSPVERIRFTAEKIGYAGEEVFEALQLIRKRIKRTDDFDVERFLADVASTLKSSPDSMEGWDKIYRQGEEIDRVRREGRDPWGTLDVDWSQFHPAARVILDDPFYWDCENEIAPHGNDTGADLLEDYCRWEKRNSEKSPLLFLSKLLKGWDVEAEELSVTEKDEVLRLGRERSIEMDLYNQATIALAFAVLKMRGSCPKDVKDLAVKALKRMVILMEGRLNDQVQTEFDNCLRRMSSKLRSSPS